MAQNCCNVIVVEMLRSDGCVEALRPFAAAGTVTETTEDDT